MALPSATFSDLPTELVDMILNTIPKLYSPKEAAQQLSILTLVNKEFYFKAKKIHSIIFADQFKKLFLDSEDPVLKSPEYQMRWCERYLLEVARKTEFSYSQ